MSPLQPGPGLRPSTPRLPRAPWYAPRSYRRYEFSQAPQAPSAGLKYQPARPRQADRQRDPRRLRTRGHEPRVRPGGRSLGGGRDPGSGHTGRRTRGWRGGARRHLDLEDLQAPPIKMSDPVRASRLRLV